MALLSHSVAFSIAGYADQQKKRKALCPGNKVLILGSSGVGKTRLLLRLAGSSAANADSPSTPVIHGDYLTRVLSMDGGRAPVKLELWHTAGQEKFGSAALPASLFRRARAAVIVYDVTKRQSFRDVAMWASQLRERLDQQQLAQDAPFTLLLVGHRPAKASYNGAVEVSTEEGRHLAAALDATAFIECCAATDENVQSCLRSLTDSFVRPEPWRWSSSASMREESAKLSTGKTKESSASFAAVSRHESAIASAVRKSLVSSRGRARFTSDDRSG